MHEESGDQLLEAAELLSTATIPVPGPKKVTYPLVMRDSFCEHEVYCSPPCNTTVTSVWSPASTRCYPKVPEIGMPRKNRLLYSCVLLGITSRTLYEPLCQAAFCCEEDQCGDDEPAYCSHICDDLFQRGSLLTLHLKNMHSICRPSGHSRSRYKLDHDGYFRLQRAQASSHQVLCGSSRYSLRRLSYSRFEIVVSEDKKGP